METKSRTDIVDPKRTMPQTLIALPKRPKDRKDKDDPMFVKSNAETELARRVNP
jgi:hypothetical protein